MWAHRITRNLRKLLPASVVCVIRRLGTAALTPLVFSWHTGHWRSCLSGKIVDRTGQILPWYTYPAIEFLRHQDFKAKHVLEWGAGYSTLWWAERAQRVMAFDDDPRWVQYLTPLLPPNASIQLVRGDIADLDRWLRGRYDVIIIDGLDRFRCAVKSLDLLAPDGAIVVDNAEGYWGPQGEYPIIDVFRAAGLARVDFYGHAPGVVLPHCTSVFFRDRCFLLTNPKPPVRSEVHCNT